MSILYEPVRRAIAGYKPIPFVSVRFRLLRDGEVTAGDKFLTLYRSYSEVGAGREQIAFSTQDGEYTRTLPLGLAAMLAQGEWFALGIDDALPRRVRAVYLSLTESATITCNITSGEGGGGQQGDPGQVSGLVRVERLPANREIVLVERPADGEWRLAGHGPTPDGSGSIDVRVVGGDVYAIGVDDYGVVFVPDLAVQVGQRIRPIQYAGWLYEITDAGQLPSAEPEWWAAVGENPSRPLGTARAVARRYYQPIAHGPVPVEVI